MEAKRLSIFVESRREFARTLESARDRHELQVRLIHGDPKVTNIMIDDISGKGTSIVDLDTVKPGLIHYDFGDALRSIGNPASGSEPCRLRAFSSSASSGASACRAAACSPSVASRARCWRPTGPGSPA